MSTNPLGAGNERSDEGQKGSEFGMTDPRLAQLEAKLLRTAIPAPAMDREKMWYECGRQAALAEIQQQGVAAVGKVALPEKKATAWHWGTLLATGVAMLLSVVTWRQGQELRSLRGSLAEVKPVNGGVAVRSHAQPEAFTKVSEVPSVPEEKVAAKAPKDERKEGRARSAPAKISARELAQIYSAPRNTLSFAGVRRELGVYGWAGDTPSGWQREEESGEVSGAEEVVKEPSERGPVEVPATLTPFQKWPEGWGDGL